MPVVPATQEVEAGESLEPGMWRLQRQDHATALQPGNRVRFCLKKTNKPKAQHSQDTTLNAGEDVCKSTNITIHSVQSRNLLGWGWGGLLCVIPALLEANASG